MYRQHFYDKIITPTQPDKKSVGETRQSDHVRYSSMFLIMSNNAEKFLAKPIYDEVNGRYLRLFSGHAASPGAWACISFKFLSTEV